MRTITKARDVRPEKFYLNTEYSRMRDGEMVLKPIVIFVESVTKGDTGVQINTTEIRTNEDGNVRAQHCFYRSRFSDELPFHVVNDDMALKSYLSAFRNNLMRENGNDKNKDEALRFVAQFA